MKSPFLKLTLPAMFFSCCLAQAQSYEGHVDLGASIGSYNRMDVSFINGIRINENFYTGVGLGMQTWQTTFDVTMPVFYNFEAKIDRGLIDPLFDLRLGYSFDFSNNKAQKVMSEEGIYFSSTIGFQWKIGHRLGLKLSSGYQYQTTKFQANFGTFNQRLDIVALHSLISKIGLVF